MKNPYDRRTEEQKYLAFDHALNAISKDDCPYLPEDSPEMVAIWDKAFSSKTKVKKATKLVDSGTIITYGDITTVSFNSPTNTVNDTYFDVEHIPEENLIKELVKRAKIEYDKLEVENNKLQKRRQYLANILNLEKL